MLQHDQEKLRRPKRRDSAVTIISAIICHDAIVVATDSRTTDSGGSRDDTTKSAVLSFKNGHAIVAVSGDADLGSLLAEQLQVAAPSVELKDYRSAPEALNAVLLAFKDDQAKRAYGCATDKLHEQFLIRGVNFAVVLAYYFAKQAYIYSAEVPSLQFVRRDYPYWSLGCGKDVADYLLRAFDFPQKCSHDTALAAVYVVGEVKRSDCRCGGPTQLTLASSEAKPEKLTQQAVQAMEEQMTHVAGVQQQECQRQIQAAIESTRLAYQSLLPGSIPLED